MSKKVELPTGEDALLVVQENTSLHTAAAEGDLDECVRSIEVVGTAVDAYNARGYTALMLAAVNKQPHIVSYLLQKQANPNAKTINGGDTALHLIALAALTAEEETTDYNDLAELLLACGADAMQLDDSGLSAIDIAPSYLQPVFEAMHENEDAGRFPQPLLSSIEDDDDADVLHVPAKILAQVAEEKALTGHVLEDDDVEVMEEVYTERATRYTLSLAEIARFMVQQLESKLTTYLAERSGPFCLLVRSDWLVDCEAHFLQALKTRLDAHFTEDVLDQPLFAKLSTQNIAADTVNKVTKERRKDIFSALGRGHAVVMTAATTQPLDLMIKDLVTHELQMPRFTREMVAHACESFFPPHEEWSIPDEDWVTCTAPQDFYVTANTLRVESTAEEIVNALRTQVRRRMRALASQRPSLGINELQGMEAAKAWAHSLASDVKAAMEGRIGWDKVDRGALLEGGPGVGKTALARAIATDLGIPIIATTASSWHGAGYLNDMLRAMEKDFTSAAELSPCILFIDELDAVGSREKPGQHDQWVTWGVNHMLALMDGFNSHQKVIVLGATNFANKIDPALRRAGRLDRTIEIPLPNRKTLASLYAQYVGKEDHLLSESDFNDLAGSSIGSSGADVERIVREARRVSRNAGRALSKEDVLKCIYATPPEDQRRPMSPEELRETAYHEAGHAIMMWLGEDKGEHVQYLTVVPRADGTLGFVAYAPSEKRHTYSAKTGRHRLGVFLGGRAAEEVAFGEENIGSGCSQDLIAATRMATYMVNKWGLGPSGLLSVSENSDPRRDKQVEQLLQETYKAAVASLTEHRELMTIIAETLIEKSEISGAEFRAIAEKYLGDSASSAKKRAASPRA